MWIPNTSTALFENFRTVSERGATSFLMYTAAPPRSLPLRLFLLYKQSDLLISLLGSYNDLRPRPVLILDTFLNVLQK